MGPSIASTRIAVVGVCLDSVSYNAISHFIMPVPGAVVVGNVERYVGAEREVARLLDPARTRICRPPHSRT